MFIEKKKRKKQLSADMSEAFLRSKHAWNMRDAYLRTILSSCLRRNSVSFVWCMKSVTAARQGIILDCQSWELLLIFGEGQAGRLGVFTILVFASFVYFV